MFETGDGKVPFSGWIDTYERNEIQGVILARIERVEEGNFGDCKREGDGVFALRIDDGPGYRIYFGNDGDIVVLLWGGIKRTQRRDLEIARKYWKEYNA